VHFSVLLKGQLAELLMYWMRQIGRVLLDGGRLESPPRSFCGASTLAGVTASGFAFSARSFAGTDLGSSCTPNTESSDVRFFALIDLLQFLANPLPEIPHFLSRLTVRLNSVTPRPLPCAS